MTNSDLIAYASFLVSILAAMYANRSAYSADKSNKINLHFHQKAIFDDFFELKMHVAQKGRFCQLQDIAKFYFSANNSKHYFSKSISDEVNKYYNLCFEIGNLAFIVKTIDEEIKLSNLLKIERVLSKSVEIELINTLKIA